MIREVTFVSVNDIYGEYNGREVRWHELLKSGLEIGKTALTAEEVKHEAISHVDGTA